MPRLKFDRFDLTVWGVLAGLGLALAVVIGLGDQIGARVVSTYPAESALVGGRPHIRIEFAQPMQVKTVEAAFEIEPSLPGQFSWESQSLIFTPSQPLTPGVQYTARLKAGALSQGRQSVKREVVWRFSARLPEIVFRFYDAAELWRVSASGGEAQQLTQTEGNVYDFAIAPDGEQIVYSAQNEERGLDLWLISRTGEAARLLVDCGPSYEICSAPAWSPDGARIAYSYEAVGLTPGAPNSPPRPWTVDVASGQTAILFQTSQVLGYEPSWSPDGTRLAMFDGSVGSLRILNLQTSDEMLLPTQMGTMGSWSPDGEQMLFTDLVFSGEQPYASVMLADFAARTITPVLGREPNFADYGRPAWSPDGQWLAISQRVPESGPGHQVWLMRPDGSEARPIANDPAYTFSGYHWDPTGQALVFQRYALSQAAAQPGILVWQLQTNETRVLAENATLAAWLP